MTELQLYKWINDNSVEVHYNNDFTELWACPTPYDLIEFFKIAQNHLFDDGGIDCKLCNGYLAIDLVPIAEICDIEIENVVPKSEVNK